MTNLWGCTATSPWMCNPSLYQSSRTHGVQKIAGTAPFCQAIIRSHQAAVAMA
jgi:hypothetical protein